MDGDIAIPPALVDFAANVCIRRARLASVEAPPSDMDRKQVFLIEPAGASVANHREYFRTHAPISDADSAGKGAPYLLTTALNPLPRNGEEGRDI